MIKYWVGAVWLGVALVTTGCVVEGRGRPVRVVRPLHVVRVVPVVPAPRVEVVAVRPSPGHVWIGGHWNWRPDRSEYVWAPGLWAAPSSPRHVWVPGHWAAHPEGHEWREGHWELRP